MAKATSSQRSGKRSPKGRKTNVFEIKTGRPRRLPEAFVNEVAVEQAETLLEGLKSGNIIGFTAVTVNAGRCYATIRANPPTANSTEMLGRLFVLMHDIAKDA